MQRFIEKNLSDFRPIEKSRQTGNRTSFQQSLIIHTFRNDKRSQNLIATFINTTVRSIYQTGGFLLNKRDLTGQKFRIPQIIRIKKTNISSSSTAECIVSSRRRSGIRLSNQLNPRITSRISPDYLRTIILRPIINDQHFPMGISLCQNRLNSLCNESTSVIHRSDDRDELHIHIRQKKESCLSRDQTQDKTDK